MLFSRHGFPVARCRACGVRFLDPQPDDAMLAGIYSAQYFLGEPTPEAEARVQALKRATAARYADCLGKRGHSSFSPAHPMDGSRSDAGKDECPLFLLEIGCGKGEFLLEAQARGFDVAGVEFSADAAAAANRRLGAEKVQAGTVESARLQEGSFDAVVFADVVEHVRDPLSFLKRVHALLKPGGAALLITPDLDSLSARLLGRHWMEYKVEHLYYFTRGAVRKALETAGFRDIAIQPNVKALSLDYVYHHFVRFPVPVFTPLLKVLRALCPTGLAHRHWHVRASGMLVTARK